jgi:hypothetical protein
VAKIGEVWANVNHLNKIDGQKDDKNDKGRHIRLLMIQENNCSPLKKKQSPHSFLQNCRSYDQLKLVFISK